MKRSAIILTLALVCSYITGCYSDDPVPQYTEMALDLRINAVDTSDMAWLPPYAPLKLDIFFKDDASGKTYGTSVNFNSPQAILADTVDGRGRLDLSVPTALPYGTFTLWIWGNVPAENMYSCDRYSVKLENNRRGSLMTLAPARTIKITPNTEKIKLGMSLMSVPFKMAVDTTDTRLDGFSVESTYYFDVYDYVDADGNYSTSGNGQLQFDDLAVTAPDSTVFLFPSSNAVGSLLTMSVSGPDHTRYVPANTSVVISRDMPQEERRHVISYTDIFSAAP